jgi:HEAT repeat protein
VAALLDPEDAVRVAAVRALRERGDRRAVDPLMSLITSPTTQEYEPSHDEAVRTLALLGDPELPRRIAAELLARPEELTEHDLDAQRRLARAGGNEAVSATIGDLIAHMREGSAPDRARQLVVALAPESVEPLIDALGSDSRSCRKDAALALGSTHESRAVEPLCAVLLGDGDPAVRKAAAWALGEIKDPAAIERLMASARDGDHGVRTEALASFDRFGNAAIAVSVEAVVRVTLGDRSGPPIEVPPPQPNGPARPQVESGSGQPLPDFRASPLLRRLLGR